MIGDLLREAEEKMDQAVEHVGSEFATVRTGRANPQILHRVMVDYYGSPTSLQQLASISVPEPRMLVLTPFDKSALGNIEKAIQQSDIGVNPTNDGNLLRIVFPSLTEERRKDLVKMIKNMAEDGRVAVRNIRRHAKSDMEALHGEISDDDIRRGEEELQKLTDRSIDRIDALVSNKEEELLEV